jgi:hypothetical protein
MRPKKKMIFRFLPFTRLLETKEINLISPPVFSDELGEWRHDVALLLHVSQDREDYKFSALRKVMRELLEWRRQLLAGTLTTDQTRELKLRIINKVDWGNR